MPYSCYCITFISFSFTIIMYIVLVYCIIMYIGRLNVYIIYTVYIYIYIYIIYFYWLGRLDVVLCLTVFLRVFYVTRVSWSCFFTIAAQPIAPSSSTWLDLIIKTTKTPLFPSSACSVWTGANVRLMLDPPVSWQWTCWGVARELTAYSFSRSRAPWKYVVSFLLGTLTPNPGSGGPRSPS